MDVSALYATWRIALDRYRESDDESDSDAEQRAWDTLVDYVDAHGLTDTEWDPRRV
jgi:hypothetical protein